MRAIIGKQFGVRLRGPCDGRVGASVAVSPPPTTAAAKAPRIAPAGLLSPDRAATPDEGERIAAHRKPGRSSTAGRCHVLLIEDDVASANALRVILTMHGCEVALAGSLERGLDLLRTNPTAIVVDLMLPDGDGIEILARVREASLPIRVVVTTAVGDPARLATVHRFKPDAILRKPFEVHDLLVAIGVA